MYQGRDTFHFDTNQPVFGRFDGDFREFESGNPGSEGTVGRV